MEQDIAGLYENWFIETCDEWVIPYIGDLLGVRPLYPASPGTFSARAYVANTLDYRRSKGTAAMLEQLAADVTGWPARVVEFFQLLATTQYLNHLRPQNLITRRPARHERAGATGRAVRNDIPHSGYPAHLERTRSLQHSERGHLSLAAARLSHRPHLDRSRRHPSGKAKPGRSPNPADGRYTFDPLGVNAPLFNRPQTKTDATLLTDEINVPGLLRRRPLYDELEALRQV